VPQHVARLVTRLVIDNSASRRLVVDYFDYATRPVASTRHAARRVARRRLLHLGRASRCLGLSRGSLLTTSTTPGVRMLLHVARHVMRLVVPLVVNYSASRRLVVDYFDYAARPGASARCRLLRLRRASGCLSTSCGSSRGSSSTTPPRVGSSSTTSTMPHVRLLRHATRLITWLVVDYFTSAARSGASARRTARC
jgi:hypothetical protein